VPLAICTFAVTGCQHPKGLTAARVEAAYQGLMPPKMSTTPDELIPECHQSVVRLRMGRPTEIRAWRSGDATLGEVWYYEDYWWTSERRRGQNFGSWEIYLDERQRFAGWRLASPVPQSPDAREKFFRVRPPEADLGIKHGSGVRVDDLGTDSPAGKVDLFFTKLVDGEEVEMKLLKPGLRADDVILNLNGVPVGDRRALAQVLLRMKPGKGYPITIKRGSVCYYGTITPDRATD